MIRNDKKLTFFSIYEAGFFVELVLGGVILWFRIYIFLGSERL